MRLHRDPVAEAMRLELVRRGTMTPELDTDLTPEDVRREAAQVLLDILRWEGGEREATLEETRMPHPQGRTPYSKPKPGARTRKNPRR